MEDSFGNRTLRIARRMGIAGIEAILVRSGFDRNRLYSILHDRAKCQDQEIERLAQTIGVSSSELKYGRVETLLVNKGQEWRYPRLWPKILERSGLRGNGNPQADVTLAEELLEEDSREQLYNPDDPLPWWTG